MARASLAGRLGAIFTLPVAHPRVALLLATLIAVVSLFQLPSVTFDFSLEQLYPADSPHARFHSEHLERFGRTDNVLFLVREGDPFDPAIAEVEQAVAAVPGIGSTVSPLSLDVVEGDGAGGLVARSLRPGDDHPLADGTLIANNGSAGAIAATISDTHNFHEAREAIVVAVESAVRASAQQDGATWHLAGVPMVRTAYVRLMMDDLATLLPLALSVSALFFVLSFRDARHVLLGVGAVGLGALAATAGYAATGTAFNVFTPAFVAVIVVVGTSDLVHLVHRFADHCARLGDAEQAAAAAAREVGLACLLTSTTTAIGFFALLTTEIPPIRIFGLATGIGVLLTFLCTFLVVPPMLARIGPPSAAASRHAASGSERMIRVGAWVLGRPRRILLAGAVVSAVLAVAASTLTVQHRILDDVRSSAEVARAQDFMEAHLGAVLPLQVEIGFPEGAADPLDPEALAASATLTDWLRTQPEVGTAVGLPDLVGPTWEALSGTEGLPDSREAAAQTLLMLGLAGDDPTTGFLVENPAGGWRERIACRVKDIGNEGTMALVADLRAEGQRLFGPLGAEVTPTGVAFLAQEVNVTLTRQFAGSFGIALGLITVIWLVLTRSPRRTMIALVPNVLPLLALLALMAGIGLALKPSTAMVLSVGLGIAVDDTIHFLARYEQRRGHGRDATGAVLDAYATAGRSMLDTSIVLVAGFGIFAFANFAASFNFGMLTAWTVVAALGADLLLLGPLLVVFDRR